jgi:hypothetical protein
VICTAKHEHKDWQVVVPIKLDVTKNKKCILDMVMLQTLLFYVLWKVFQVSPTSAKEERSTVGEDAAESDGQDKGNFQKNASTSLSRSA